MPIIHKNGQENGAEAFNFRFVEGEPSAQAVRFYMTYIV